MGADTAAAGATLAARAASAGPSLGAGRLIAHGEVRPQNLAGR